MFTKILSVLVLVCAVQAQPYTQKVLAAVLVGEAGNQGQRGMSAVAEVVRQRSIETKKTPTQVVLSKRAFSCLNHTTAERLILKQQAEPEFRIALVLADQLLRDPKSLPNHTKRATHFTRKEEKPWWARGHKPVAIIGAHAFYRLPKSL